jgi:hypothetical protein
MDQTLEDCGASFGLSMNIGKAITAFCRQIDAISREIANLPRDSKLAHSISQFAEVGEQFKFTEDKLNEVLILL